MSCREVGWLPDVLHEPDLQTHLLYGVVHEASSDCRCPFATLFERRSLVAGRHINGAACAGHDVYAQRGSGLV